VEIFRQKKGTRKASQESVPGGKRMHPASLPIPAKTPRMMRARCCALLTAGAGKTPRDARICGMRRIGSDAAPDRLTFFCHAKSIEP
jgi:hypothetical protein